MQDKDIIPPQQTEDSEISKKEYSTLQNVQPKAFEETTKSILSFIALSENSKAYPQFTIAVLERANEKLAKRRSSIWS